MATLDEMYQQRRQTSQGNSTTGSSGGGGAMGGAASQAYQQGFQEGSAPATQGVPPAQGWNGFPLQGFKTGNAFSTANGISNSPFDPTGFQPFSGPFDKQKMFDFLQQSPLLKMLLERYMGQSATGGSGEQFPATSGTPGSTGTGFPF